jgi:hypothetical protein
MLMLKRVSLLIAFSLLSMPLLAQNWTTVISTMTSDPGPAGPSLLVKGKLCFTPTDDKDNPLKGFGIGGGGQATGKEICVPIANGAITQTLQVPNPEHTTPPNIRFRIRVNDDSGNSIVYRNVVFTGNPAFTGDTFNFDQYVPTTSVAPLGQTVQGPVEVIGDFSVTGDCTGCGSDDGNGGGAPTGASYVTMQSESGLTNETPLAAVIQRGAVASRPAAAVPGRVYCTNDSGSMRCTRDNGASWDDLLVSWSYIDGKPSTFPPSAHSHVESDVTNLVNDLAAKEATANKGAVNGYAPLDGSSKVPISNLPIGATSSTVTVGNDSRITGAEQTANKGAASGYAPLDGSSKVPISNLPTGATSSTVAVGNDSRITGAEQTANKGAANGYAPLDGSSLIPIINVPTGTSSATAMIGNDSRVTNAIQASGTNSVGVYQKIVGTKTIGDSCTSDDGTQVTIDCGGTDKGLKLAPNTAVSPALAGTGGVRIIAKSNQAQISVNGGAFAPMGGGTSCTSGTPSGPTDTGTTGQCEFDSSYYYLAIASNTWERVAWDVSWTGGTVATPTHSPDTSTVNATASVTIADSTSGATLKYCIDNGGTCDPTTGTTYSSAVSVSPSGATARHLRSIGQKAGLTDSTVKDSTYSFKAATPTCSPAGGSYGSTQTVTCSSSTSGSTTRCTIDGSTPTGSSTTCTSISVASSATLKAIAFLADYSNSNEDDEAYTIGGGGSNTLSESVLKTATSVSSTATPAVTVTVASTSDLLISCIDYKLATAITSIVDNNSGGSNTWTSIGAAQDATNVFAVACHKTQPAHTGSLTITYTLSSAASDRTYITVIEVSGSSATPVIDGTNGSLVSSSSSWSLSATVGTTGDELFAFGGDPANAITYTAGTGFTLISNGGGSARSILEWSTSTVADRRPRSSRRVPARQERWLYGQ